MSVINRLRAATAEAHQELEACLDMVREAADRTGRRTLVARFYALHLGAERALAPLLAGYPGLEFDARRRSPWLAADLAELGLDPRKIPPCRIASPASTAEALGFFYVLEGSTLGGKVIAKAMAAKGADMRGLGFLTPYGEETGGRWRDFMALLEAAGPRAGDAIVRGGMNGFAAARRWLCPEPVAA